jgi:hypothetical protein
MNKEIVRILVNPLITIDQRYRLYEDQRRSMKLQDLEQLINIMIYEFGVPEYLIRLQLSRDPTKWDDLKDHHEKPIVAIEPPDETPRLKLLDYSCLKNITMSSEDSEEIDDSDEVLDNLMKAVDACQHFEATERDIRNYGPMNNDNFIIEADFYSGEPKVAPKSWCHLPVDDTDVSVLHGMYTCLCFLSEDEESLSMKCRSCDQKIKTMKDSIRLPYGEHGGWHPTLFCNIECAVIDPPFEITPQVQIKFLVGVELMSRLPDV